MDAVTAAKSRQSCPILCDPVDGSPSGSAVPGILQARTLEWVAISSSNAWKWKVKKDITQSCPTLSDPMDGSLPGSPVHGIFRQEYWSEVPLPSRIDMGFPCGASGKEPACQCRRCKRRVLGRSPGGGNGNPPQCFCLGNPMDRGAYHRPLVSLQLDEPQGPRAEWNKPVAKRQILCDSSCMRYIDRK